MTIIDIPAEVLQYLPTTVNQYQVERGMMIRVQGNWALVIANQVEAESLSAPYVSPNTPIFNERSRRYNETIKTDTIPAQRVAKIDFLKPAEESTSDTFTVTEQDYLMYRPLFIAESIMAMVNNTRWISSIEIKDTLKSDVITDVEDYEVYNVLTKLSNVNKVIRHKKLTSLSKRRKPVYHYKLA